MRNSCVIISIFIACLFLIGFSEEQIPNLTHLRAEVFTSGQPSETGFQELSAMGIKTVINVLPEAQCLKGEQGMVQTNHMVYKKLPFEAETLNRDTVDDFAYLMLTSEQPVLIHCSTGNHVGGLWLAYRVLVERAPVTVAVAESRRIGIKPAMEHSVLRWLGEEVTTVKASTRK